MYNNLLNDPRASMTFQAGQSAMLAGSQYVGNEIQRLVPTGNLKAYFKVSNSYVLSKILLIIFPFRNNNWMRKPRPSNSNDQQTTLEQYAFPYDDKNAPDYYIPVMGFATYVILFAMIAGVQGNFHPEVFGLETSSTIAYLVVDYLVLRGGLYMLSISANGYDLAAYTCYKFVPIILILLIKSLSTFTLFNWVAYVYLLVAYGFFELRSIRFNLFGGINNSTQTMSSKTIKKSNYFLFVYAFVIQGALLWFLTR